VRSIEKNPLKKVNEKGGGKIRNTVKRKRERGRGRGGHNVAEQNSV